MSNPVPPLSILPDHIGPYRILQVLGEGGMGIVYEAEETGPVRRRVAIKAMRAGSDSREVVARFETERQALAVMNHPGIARMLGAGTTPQGQPYFAMELVRGLPIARYCDTHRLSVEARVELFILVCHAVQHAHQKGVSHRDLKPSNILVTEQDGVAQPKIIDFGIAKAFGQRLTDITMVTLSGQAIGTAAYMSPEQVDPAGVDADTRADIYSLGVMLYELLTGSLPLDPKEIGLHPFLARLASGEINPPTPSVRLRNADLPQVITAAQTHRTDPKRLRRALTGDLDWIVMKAMAPERTRRYETANGLAMDLQRHLHDEPVVARSPSTRYRVEKFLRRHRLGVLAASTILAVVLASTVLATVGFVRASRAERTAAEEAEAATAVTTFLVGLFQSTDPREAGQSSPVALELLDRGARQARSELGRQPLHQARLFHTLGSVYASLSRYEPARDLLQDALSIRERELGPDDPSLVETLIQLGDVAQTRGEMDEAERYLQRALNLGIRLFGREHILPATTLASLGTLRIRQGRYAEAESIYREVLPLDARVRPPSDLRIARNIRSMAAALWSQNRLDEADTLYRRALELQERLQGRDHFDVAATLLNLGAVYYQQERYDDAEMTYDRARRIAEATLGTEHLLVANVYNNLGETHWKLGHPEDAEPLFRRALAIKEKLLPPTTVDIATTLNGLAGLLRDQGRLVEAEPLYRRALAIREKAYPPTHRRVIETRNDYALLLRRAGRITEAEQMAPRPEEEKRE